MTDENKDVNKEPAKQQPKGTGKQSQTKAPRGPSMLDFGKELPPGLRELIEADMKKALIESMFGKSENIIDQKFSIRMPYSDTCKAYLQTKSGFLCVNSVREVGLALQMIQSIASEIRDEDAAKDAEKRVSENKPQHDLPGAYGIDQRTDEHLVKSSNPSDTTTIDQV